MKTGKEQNMMVAPLNISNLRHNKILHNKIIKLITEL